MEEIKKYLPFVYGILGLIAIFIIYKFVVKVKNGAETAADYGADMVVFRQIATKTGMKVDAVVRCHSIALEVSRVLETNTKMSMYEKLSHLVYDSDIVKALSKAKSDKEMLLISSFYTIEMTDGRKLYDDCKEEINFNSTLAAIPFIAIIS